MSSDATHAGRLERRNAGAFDALSGWLSLAAVGATFASAIGLFLVSSLALESIGIGYTSSGGGLVSKFHPSTFLAFFALALRCIASGRPERTLWRLMTADTGCVLLVAAVVVMSLMGTLVTKTPVTPLIDTFVLPIVMLILLRDLDMVALRWLALAIGAILCINAGLAVIEVLRGMHFIAIPVAEGSTADPTRGDAVFDWRVDAATDWRAQALFGHPLVNGLITGVFILCIVSPAAAWVPLVIRVPLLALQVVAMFSFGARTALVLSLVFGGMSALNQSIVARAGRPISPRAIALGTLVVILVIGGGFVLGQTDFVGRTITRFSQDSGSASTRLTMFQLFDEVSWNGLLFGPDKDVVATAQRVYGLEFGIESSWVGLVLTYGVIVTAMVLAALAAFSRSLMRVGGRGTGLALILFFILVSVAASMSGKITSFAMTVVLIVVFLRRDALGRLAPRASLV